MIWLVLAAQLSAPTPTNLHDWFVVNDFPPYLGARSPHLWLVPIRIDVSPDGAIKNCIAEASSGEPYLDKRTCDLVRKRAIFTPARWADGSAAYGVYRTGVNWVVMDAPQTLPKLYYPDLELSVNALPSGSSASVVRVMFSVDEQGRASSCIAEPGGGIERADNLPSLVPIACEELLKSYTPVPAKDSGGKPVRSVQDALVLFSTKSR
jgi:hypothetical protein